MQTPHNSPTLAPSAQLPLQIRQFSTGTPPQLIPYETSWNEMRDFTQQRDLTTPDELWLLQHPPVFTQGLAGEARHILNSGDIPVVQTDRGGQVTYHGPGQLMLYPLLHLKRHQLGIRQLVEGLEQTVIAVLNDYSVVAQGRRDAPGVYVKDAKIASIGLRVRRQTSYHGLAFNVCMDLSPFKRINPCGFSQLTMTQLADFVPNITVDAVIPHVIHHFLRIFRYTEHSHSR